MMSTTESPAGLGGLGGGPVPPVVPLRHSGWPVRRMPMWTLLIAVILVIGVVLVSLSRKPSNAEEVSAFNSYLRDMNAAVESCAGGVTESRQALDSVTASSLKTALNLVSYDAANCSPANNEPLQDLTQYQVTESLAKFDLADCANDYITWSFDAAQAQLDMLAILKAQPPVAPAASPAASAGSGTLRHALAIMDAERGKIDTILRTAEHALSDPAPLPSLPA
jgi:hypothetical protein